MLLSCDRPQLDARIPTADGQLVLELRYPSDGMVLNRDSIAVWGTVGTGTASLLVNDREVVVERNGGFADFIPLSATDTAVLEFVAVDGTETKRKTVRIVRRVPPSGTPAAALTIVPHDQWVILRRAPSDTADSATQARPIYSRWTPSGQVAVPLDQRSRVFSDVRTTNALRLRLAPDLHVWIPAEDAIAAPQHAFTAPRLARLRVTADSGETTVRIPAPEPVNASVEYAEDRLYWTVWATPLPGDSMPGLDTAVGMVQQVSRGTDYPRRIVAEVTLAERPLGWKTEWRDGEIVLRIRSARPLRSGLNGLIIALDAGHPPGGTTGPTGYMESEMTLSVARATADRLSAIGVRSVLTRDDASPLSLDERLARAERAGAHALISIHGNSPGPGRPPRAVLGTQTIWLQPMALPLARALLDSVRSALGQGSLGAHREDFAVNRPTWFPAVLVEGTGLVLPEREAYLRTPEGIGAYANGIVAGVQAWVATYAPADSAPTRAAR